MFAPLSISSDGIVDVEVNVVKFGMLGMVKAGMLMLSCKL